MTCLTRIAPLLVPGGRIVLDDYYKWSGCRTRGRRVLRRPRRASGSSSGRSCTSSVLSRIRRRLRGDPPAAAATPPVEPAVRVARAARCSREGRRGRVRANAERLKARPATTRRRPRRRARSPRTSAASSRSRTRSSRTCRTVDGRRARPGRVRALRPRRGAGADAPARCARSPTPTRAELGPEAWYELLARGLRRTATRRSRARSSPSSTATCARTRRWPDAQRDSTRCAPGSPPTRTRRRRRRRPAAAAPSRSWTTATPAPTARRRTSATTSRASPRSGTSSATAACACTARPELVGLLDAARRAHPARAARATTSTPTSR